MCIFKIYNKYSEGAPMNEHNKEVSVNLRELKALEIAAHEKIVYADAVWLVPSQSTGVKYRVTIGTDPACTCEDWLLRKSANASPEPC